MNPAGMFKDGKRLREYSMKDLLPLSGKLIPEFDRRRNIRDMFSRKPSLPTAQSTQSSILPQSGDQLLTDMSEVLSTVSPEAADPQVAISVTPVTALPSQSSPNPASPVPPASPANSINKKRSLGDQSTNRPLKRSKSVSTAANGTSAGKGQRSLKGFFKPKISTASTIDGTGNGGGAHASLGSSEDHTLQAASTSPETKQTKNNTVPLSPTPNKSPLPSNNGITKQEPQPPSLVPSPTTTRTTSIADQEFVHDPVISKESWSKLFTKPAAPRCEGHHEPCISMLTKKSGFNCGRSFWMCARPVGPTGTKEKNTQWRCQTFIWCSDWNGGGSGAGS